MEEQQSQQETQLTPKTLDVQHETHVKSDDSPQEAHSSESSYTPSEEVLDVDSFKKRLGQQARKHDRERAEWLREKEEILRKTYHSQHSEYIPNEHHTSEPIDLSAIKPEQFVSLVEYANQVRSNTDRQQEIHNKVKDSYYAAREKYPDIDDYAAALNDMPESPAGFAESLALLDNADDVIYEVVKNAKEYQKLVNMRSPIAVAQRLKDISHYLSSKGREVSKVDSPIKPLSASGESAYFRQKTCSERRAELREKSRHRGK